MLSQSYLVLILSVLKPSQIPGILKSRVRELLGMEGMTSTAIKLFKKSEAHQETWHSNNWTNRDGIVMSSDYSGLTCLTDYSVAIV
jgi:hypothetical protein